jgi:succinate dehydrogenase/fumarate reductase flavoprotein subunit
MALVHDVLIIGGGGAGLRAECRGGADRSSTSQLSQGLPDA